MIVEYADDLPATDTDDAVALALVYMQAEKKVRPVPLCLLQLDPLDLQVRALLRAHLNNPLVYVSGEDWKDEGFFACGVAGQAVYGILEPWRRASDHDSSWKEWVRPFRSFIPLTTVDVSYTESKRCPKRNRGWGYLGQVYGLETGEEGKQKADAYFQKMGCAFLLDADTMLLPWPGGPCIWRRVPTKEEDNAFR